MFPGCCFRQRTYMTQGLVNGVFNAYSKISLEANTVRWSKRIRSLHPPQKIVPWI